MEMQMPPTLYINVKERTDRVEHMEKEFASWPVPIERVDAVKMSPGWKGCTQSHRKVIQIAKERGYPWVLYLEDDCKLTPDALQRFQQMLPLLWATKDKWDIFYGGVVDVKKQKLISEDPILFEVKAMCAHFVLVPSHVYDKILADINPKESIVQIDTYYDNVFKIITPYPFLAVQVTTAQDSMDYHYQRTQNFLDAANVLTKELYPQKDMTLVNIVSVLVSVTLMYIIRRMK